MKDKSKVVELVLQELMNLPRLGTHKKHWLYKHPNLLKDIDIYRPGQVYVSDIT